MGEYFCSRHKIFVEERGWSNLRCQTGREVDAYDNEDATYLIALDRGRLVAGQRLYPATKPHMLSDVFPHLLDRPTPTAATFEWTRYFVVKERRFGRTDCRMLAAVQRHCLDRNIHTLLALVETWWLPRWRQAGFDATPLGAPQTIDGTPCLAVAIEVSAKALASVNRLGGLAENTLLRQGPEHAAAQSSRREQPIMPVPSSTIDLVLQ